MIWRARLLKSLWTAERTELANRSQQVHDGIGGYGGPRRVVVSALMLDRQSHFDNDSLVFRMHLIFVFPLKHFNSACSPDEWGANCDYSCDNSYGRDYLVLSQNYFSRTNLLLVTSPKNVGGDLDLDVSWRCDLGIIRNVFKGRF